VQEIIQVEMERVIADGIWSIGGEEVRGVM
jgi:hypothetical protein